ncbi:MAG: hypothetical protein FJ276_07250 [Planctomycetes bacterium]|nr:hypothetical protein [Planctomycetota bacterium]
MLPSTVDANQLFDERFARAVAESLEATFGYPFDLWLPGGRWTHLALGETAVDVDPAPRLRELLDQARTAGHIPVHGPSAEGYCLAIPVRHKRELAIVATASRPVVSDETLRLAAAFLRELGLREELRSRSETNESYAVEVTRSLEELFLLRQLSRHADLADLSRPATDLACATIDLLRHVVNAEAVYYLAVRNEGAQATHQRSLSVDVVAQAG